jgi:hypothetical protein
MGVNVGVCVAVPVGGTDVCVAVSVAVDGTSVCNGGVRQLASSGNIVHRTIHIRLGDLGMD